MESQPQNPEFSNSPEKLSPMQYLITLTKLCMPGGGGGGGGKMNQPGQLAPQVKIIRIGEARLSPEGKPMAVGCPGSKINWDTCMCHLILAFDVFSGSIIQFFLIQH